MSVFQPSNLLVNISSLYGQLSLKKAETSLQQSILNLSSGIRIHTAKDDPVGFVSSTKMQTEIASTSQAVANCERADAVISTADSALSHINSLLNDLRGLITQAANTGVETPETLAELQLNADAILQTIDFISESTKFNGQKLLNGSLDFTTYGLDKDLAVKLNVYQANFGGHTEKDVSVQVLQPPGQAQLYYPYGALKKDTVLNIGGTGGYQSYSFDSDATVGDIADAVNRFSDSTGVGAAVYAKSTPGNIGLTSYGKDNDVVVTASQTGQAAGNYVFRYTAPADGNDELRLNVSEGNGNNPSIIEIVLQTAADGKIQTTAQQVADLINNSPLLKDADGAGLLSASIPGDQTGLGTVTAFKEFAYYGSVENSNFLQFLAPEGSPDIQLVCGQYGEPLNVTEEGSPPTMVVHLEIDENGFVRTTANDLVRFFNDPADANSKAVLDKYGISVSSIDPKSSNLPVCATGTSANGIGTLIPTYNPNEPDCPVEGFVPNITFSSYGEGIVEAAAHATVTGKGGRNADWTLTANQVGAAYNNVGITLIADADAPSVHYDPVLKRLSIGVSPTTDTTAADVVNLINNDPEVSKYFTASLPDYSTGAGFVAAGDWATLTGGVRPAENGEQTAELGVRMFSGSDCESRGITFYSVGFGSGEFVDVQSLVDPDFAVTDRFGNVAERAVGTDVVANINNQRAVGKGQIASSVTSQLDIDVWISPQAKSGDVFGFRISGGGTLIQIGADAVPELQARIGIPSVHTTALGGLNGFLSELKDGEQHSLITDPNGAFRICQEVTDQITMLRGRLGSFQKTQIVANMEQMIDLTEIETSARSEIVDTDFALASSNMTRQQVLMQSSVSVLQQTRASQQLLLTLLQG
ncbi:hypothetical protein FACS189443_3670 [Planctomycetales bacterium]|nr:hypothetical protein FACS189443_3670 [Planctomycetales bacterium]